MTQKNCISRHAMFLHGKGNATMKIRYSDDIIPFTGSLSCPVRAERKSQPELHESVDFIHHDLIT